MVRAAAAAAAAMETEAQAHTRGSVRCARCGHSCALDAWRALPVQRTLTSVDLGACVSTWPAGAVVEVRACTGCGAAIARRRDRPGGLTA
jgi:hypothetical protein